jgi:hypothetical protein
MEKILKGVLGSGKVHEPIKGGKWVKARFLDHSTLGLGMVAWAYRSAGVYV